MNYQQTEYLVIGKDANGYAIKTIKDDELIPHEDLFWLNIFVRLRKEKHVEEVRIWSREASTGQQEVNLPMEVAAGQSDIDLPLEVAAGQPDIDLPLEVAAGHHEEYRICEDLKILDMNAIEPLDRQSCKTFGLVHIFDFQEFDEETNTYPNNIRGDAKALQNTFSQFGLEVKIHPNIRRSTLEAVMKTMSQQSFENCAGIIIVILSQGSGHIRGQDFAPNFSYDFQLPLLRIKSLSNVHKVFICQTHRWNQANRPFATTYDEIPVFKNLITLDSNFQGNVAAGDVTPLVNTLCAKLKQFGDNTDIGEILEKVADKILGETNGEQSASIKRVLPWDKSILRDWKRN